MQLGMLILRNTQGWMHLEWASLMFACSQFILISFLLETIVLLFNVLGPFQQIKR